MNPCNSLITFPGSIHNHSVTNVKLDQVSESKIWKGGGGNCLTAANTSDSNCMKKGFLNYLTYVNRKGLKVMHTNTDITFWRKERTARMFAIVASNTETFESRWNEAEIEAGSFWLKTCKAAWTAASSHKQSLQLTPNHLHEEHPVGETQKDLFAKTIDFFFQLVGLRVWVFCFFFSLYKELCVCVSWDVWIRDSHIFKVWVFGDNVSEHAWKSAARLFLKKFYFISSNSS